MHKVAQKSSAKTLGSSAKENILVLMIFIFSAAFKEKCVGEEGACNFLSFHYSRDAANGIEF